jgi:hypothetical protein
VSFPDSKSAQEGKLYPDIFPSDTTELQSGNFHFPLDEYVIVDKLPQEQTVDKGISNFADLMRYFNSECLHFCFILRILQQLKRGRFY